MLNGFMRTWSRRLIANGQSLPGGAHDALAESLFGSGSAGLGYTDMPRHPGVSTTTETLSAHVFSRLAKKAREHRGHVYPLHVGDTCLEPLAAARAEARRTDDHPRLHNYAPVQGEPALLDAVVRRIGARAGEAPSRENVQIVSGATSGLSIVARTILDPGDEVILPSPYWPLIRGIIASRGAVPVEVPFFDRIDDPSFDAEAVVEEAVTERTTALYVNTPQNPTGRILPEHVVDALANVANRHDLWVVCDEAYDELWLTDERPAPVWNRPDLRDRAVATHTLSKSYGLAGARVGYTHGPGEVMRAIRGLQTFQTYCAPRPMQLGAARALDEGDAWLDEARHLYREAGNEAADALGLRRPDGGTFLFFDASPHFRTGEDLMGFLERCLDAGVLLTPGPSCGRHYGDWARLCFTSVPPGELREALERLRTVVRP